MAKGPSIEEIEAYRQRQLAKKAALVDSFNEAMASTGNRNARMTYQNAFKASAKVYDDDIAEADKRLKTMGAGKKGATGEMKPLTTNEYLNQKREIGSQKEQGDLAKSRIEQEKQFNQATAPALGLGGAGFADAMKLGPGHANYTYKMSDQKGPDGLYLPELDAYGNKIPISSVPTTVTIDVPLKTDAAAAAAQKQRAIDAKAVATRVAGWMPVGTTKVTPDMVYGGEEAPTVVVDPKTGQKKLQGNGFIFPQGYTLGKWQKEKEQFDKLQEPITPETSKEVTIPVSDYQRMLGTHNSLQSPENAVPSAVATEMRARAIGALAKQDAPERLQSDFGQGADVFQRGAGLSAPAPRLNIGANVPMAGPERMPDINPSQPNIGLLQRASAGIPLAQLNVPSDAVTPDARLADMTQSALPVAEYVGAADRAKGIYDDLLKRRQISALRDTPEFGAKFTIDPATGRKIFESGSLLPRASAEEILAGSPIPELHPGNSELQRLTGKLISPEGVKGVDPVAYYEMQRARDAATTGEFDPSRLEGLARTAMMYNPNTIAIPLANATRKYYAPLLESQQAGGTYDLPVPLQDQVMLP
jgi:hypothetical protein